jgi:hypothetical protein
MLSTGQRQNRGKYVKESSPRKLDFINMYLSYTNQTECPTFFHRWTAISALSAYLGRSVWFNHGHFRINANVYVMLIGSPGTKKSSAIKIGAKLLKQAGYNTFAAKKTRQEKFLEDLAEQSIAKDIANGGADDDMFSSLLDSNIFGNATDESDNYSTKPPAECFVAADEFNNFIGVNNLDFASILGELWDFEGVYDYKLKNSKSLYIPNPYVTILGGNTPTGFSQAFPVEAIGQGFFSRLLLIYGEPSGVKYTIPPAPDMEKQRELIAMLTLIKEHVQGEMIMTPDAIALLDKIYHKWEGLDDARFEHYTNRRLTHLIKLCMIVAAARLSVSIEPRDIVEANTILSFTEQLMPKALGEFGKSRHSAVAHKIITLLDAASEPVTLQSIWKYVHQDLDNRNQLVEILGNLAVADKLQSVDGGGYISVRAIREEGLAGAVDWNLLTQIERDLV